MRCHRLKKLQHGKNRLTRPRSTQAVFQVKQPNFHTRKKTFWNMKHRFCFNFFNIYQNYNNSYLSFYISDIKKLKTMWYTRCFPFNNLKIGLFNLNYNPLNYPQWTLYSLLHYPSNLQLKQSITSITPSLLNLSNIPFDTENILSKQQKKYHNKYYLFQTHKLFNLIFIYFS